MYYLETIMKELSYESVSKNFHLLKGQTLKDFEKINTKQLYAVSLRSDVVEKSMILWNFSPQEILRFQQQRQAFDTSIAKITSRTCNNYEILEQLMIALDNCRDMKKAESDVKSYMCLDWNKTQNLINLEKLDLHDKNTGMLVSTINVGGKRDRIVSASLYRPWHSVQDTLFGNLSAALIVDLQPEKLYAVSTSDFSTGYVSYEETSIFENFEWVLSDYNGFVSCSCYDEFLSYADYCHKLDSKKIENPRQTGEILFKEAPKVAGVFIKDYRIPGSVKAGIGYAMLNGVPVYEFNSGELQEVDPLDVLIKLQ